MLSPNVLAYNGNGSTLNRFTKEAPSPGSSIASTPRVNPKQFVSPVSTLARTPTSILTPTDRSRFGGGLHQNMRASVASSEAAGTNDSLLGDVKRAKWTDAEVDALRRGVEKHGDRRWSVILQENQAVFSSVKSRSNVDLKDKWRNLSKNG